jgi:hypothetical protein
MLPINRINRSYKLRPSLRLQASTSYRSIKQQQATQEATVATTGTIETPTIKQARQHGSTQRNRLAEYAGTRVPKSCKKVALVSVPLAGYYHCTRAYCDETRHAHEQLETEQPQYPVRTEPTKATRQVPL